MPGLDSYSRREEQLEKLGVILKKNYNFRKTSKKCKHFTTFGKLKKILDYFYINFKRTALFKINSIFICDMEYRKRAYCQKLYFGLIFHITGVYLY